MEVRVGACSLLETTEARSHDPLWVGKPKGGKFRPYTTLFQKFLPALKKAGFSEEVIRLLTIQNPAEAFTLRVRAKR